MVKQISKMDSIPLEMDNIFDDYDDVDDIGPTRLPDLEEMDTNLEPMVERYDDQGADGENEVTAGRDFICVILLNLPLLTFTYASCYMHL